MMRGHTLLELVLVLFLLGLATSAMIGPARHQVDRAAVTGAREALVGLFARARAEARARGGALLRVRPAEGRAWIEAGGGTRATVDLPRTFGVTLAVPGEPDEIALLFDALGIGRHASRTFRLTRGGAATSLVVAAYGRVERR